VLRVIFSCRNVRSVYTRKAESVFKSTSNLGIIRYAWLHASTFI